MSSWLHNNIEFTDPQNHYGFVYIITNLKENKFYVGKKFFTKAGYRQAKGKRKKIRKDSDWLNYWGSNKTLQDDVKQLGEKNFKREILFLCKNRAECGYREAMEIMTRHALERSDYYNDWVSFKITKMHVNSFMTIDKGIKKE